MESHHIKSVNTDKRSKKSIRFASSRERSKRASADVYRSYKRKFGVTSAATREEAVHNSAAKSRSNKRHRAHHVALDDSSRTAVINLEKIQDDDGSDPELDMEISTTFASELDETLDRNSSEIFGKFHRQVWGLVRSLPEILHHADKIIDLMLSHVLSPASAPERPSYLEKKDDEMSDEPDGFIVNHATADILHLLAVLARDLRHEIHPYLHEKILPRIFQDLLSPPPPPPDSGKQPIPLDVSLVEAAFRTTSYIIRYDAETILNDIESMRKYYGITLGHRRELVRRLAAETFAPLLRKMKSASARQRHLKRVLKALIATEAQVATHSLKRTQQDAVDGISQLVFQIVRGVKGRVHSQASETIRFVLTYCTEKAESYVGDTPAERKHLALSVASAFLERLCSHVDYSIFHTVINEVAGVMKLSLENLQKASTGTNAAFNSLKLLSEVATFKSGAPLETQGDRQVDGVLKCLGTLFSRERFTSFPSDIRQEMVALSCQVWIPFQRRAGFSKHLEKSLEVICNKEVDGNGVDSVRSFANILARELVPFLTEKAALKVAGSITLSAAASLGEEEKQSSLLTVFALATKQVHMEESDIETPKDGLFFPESSSVYDIEGPNKQELLKCCFLDVDQCRWTVEEVEQFGVAIRCAPFLLLLHCADETEGQTKGNFKIFAKWISDVMDSAMVALQSADCASSVDLQVVVALSLEALSSAASWYLQVGGSQSVVQKALPTGTQVAGKLLGFRGSSIWAMRGVASFVKVLSTLDMTLPKNVDEVFDTLVPNLRSSCQALRHNTLQILSSFPKKGFVVDHADIDLDGDLDEEPSFQPGGDSQPAKGGQVGLCSIIETMLEIERTPVRLSNERLLVGMVSRVEVLARGGRLPVAYSEAAANHMIGLMYVKFSPLWPAAVRALAALATTYEDLAWPALEGKLVSVMEYNPSTEVGDTTASRDNDLVSMGFHDHHVSCVSWETSNGVNISIFGESTFEENDGEVQPHLSTDDDTFMETIWGVAQQCQQLVAKHSRIVIPAFLGFLQNQYFLYHSDDPDTRELNLTDVVPTTSVDRSALSKYPLQKKLVCFLRTFAAIDGPQQLVHHALLQKIYRALLNHHDTNVVQLALSCLLKFKPKSLMPYGSFLRELLQRGSLRNSLLKLQEENDAKKIDKSHREELVPSVSRIVFGRLSVREGKSSKDTPAARRSAILSFVSQFCRDESEIFPFIYLMVRSFIPRSVAVKEVEEYTLSDRNSICQALASLHVETLPELPNAVVEGFLHLLEGVVSQLGHRVKTYVPLFLSIVLAIGKLVSVKPEVDGGGAGDKEGDDSGRGMRHGQIRSLCYQRLSEMFSQFGNTFDFSPYGESLWNSVRSSVDLLPNMAIKAEKAPALLSLLVTLSANSGFFPLLSLHDKAVEAVVRCVAGTSLGSVMNSALSFIENLVGTSGGDNSAGEELIQPYIPLLLEQFTVRFSNVDSRNDQDETKTAKPNRPGNSGPRRRSFTWRRELQILFRISELVAKEGDSRLKDKSSVLEDLAQLLLPFLEATYAVSDEEKLSVVGILRGTTLGFDQSYLRSLFDSLSSTLAPVKGKPGIQSLNVRHEIASLIQIVGERVPELRDTARGVLTLNSVNSKRVDELDFEGVIPELNKYCSEGSTCRWESLCKGPDKDPSLLLPVVGTCFHYLHSADGVMSRTSFNAIKRLLEVSSEIANGPDKGEICGWTKLVESLVVPLSRSGLQSRDTSVRRFHVLIIREIAKLFKGHSSPNLCGDLSLLVNDENPDLDFFVGVTHVQIHRRARAFQRLRKVLNESSTEAPPFTTQSLSSVLLPLSLHPAYESKTKAEEAFALEGIATVGALSRHLPWNKYNNTLWSILTHFDRYAEQERYLVAMLCAIIDGFNFELIDTSDKGQVEVPTNDSPRKSSVWRALEKRIIPRVETLLTKEKVDKAGSRLKIIRPTIVLAMLKLYQKFPTAFFENKLPQILAVMCDTLKCKDSNAREVARNTMARIVVAMDLKYLADVIREVTITLTEGYKLHVRTAVIHTILEQLSQAHKPSPPGDQSQSQPTYFDKCVPALMDVIQLDLFGVANERKESQETSVRYVKEAGGSKGLHCIEILCKMITFQPSRASKAGLTSSSVHCVVSPLLERLRLSDVDAATIRKIREMLGRVVVGLSQNPSVTADELFPFVYATVEPFVGSQVVSTVVDDEDSDDEGDDAQRPIKVSGSNKPLETTEKSGKGKVVEWRPSTLKTSDSSKSAMENRQRERKMLMKVSDGASAPKLTGSGRHGTLDIASIQGLNDPATTNAIVFGLNALLACLKKLQLQDEPELISLMDPFVPLLTACVCHCKDNDVALVAMKCLMSLMRFRLQSVSKCSRSLGTQALIFLSSAGSSLNKNQDLTQACFRTLTYLINVRQESDEQEGEKNKPLPMEVAGEHVLANNVAMPLDFEQMKVLISLLQVSVSESSQHNPALGLIKAILSRRFTSPEFYDLMEAMLKLNVRSQKASLRQQSAGIFIRYLLDYPMGEERFESHLKQVMANIKYEYKEGRLSAVTMLVSIIERLPEELLMKHAHLIFLPMVLQLVNDDASECRAAVKKTLGVLLTRSSTEVLQSFHDYTVRWCETPGPLRVASLQVFGIFVESQSSFILANELAPKWAETVENLLTQQLDSSDWEVGYFSLICVEKLAETWETDLAKRTDLWPLVVEKLVDSHPWIKLASSRIIQQFFVSGGATTFLESNLGMLFEITKNLCTQLGVDEEEQAEELSELAIKTLAFALPTIKTKPELCFAKDSPHAGLRDPVAWLMRRLAEVAKPKGRKRRMSIFKCFAAFVTQHSDIVAPHMELMLEPLHRSDLEASNELDAPNVSHRRQPGSEEVVTESSLARDVLQLIEESCAESQELFLKAYATVKSRARDKKDQRKQAMKAEAVRDPQAAAQRRMKKQDQNKHRKKRRVEEHRQGRGAQRKRRNFS